MKKKITDVNINEIGLLYVDANLKECDFCDEQKICVSINTITKDVMCVCKDCLQEFVNYMESYKNEEE